jgi:phytoene dehydrogenase-like protein
VSRPRGVLDAVVIGGGHNGLVAATYLAKAGARVAVLERRERVGGMAELALTAGRLRTSVIRDLGLASHGLELIRPDVRVFAPQPDGRALTLWADPARSADDIRSWSTADAHAFVRFDSEVRAIGSLLAHLHAATPPDTKAPTFADAVLGLRFGRSLRKLGGPRQAREAIRVLPMAVADVVNETFETEALRGLVATRGVRYTAMGPWSAGTAAVLLADGAGNDGGVAGETAFVRGGARALGISLEAAARAAGVDVRTGVAVARVRALDGRAVGVALGSGEEIDARAVVCGIDPKTLVLDMIDPVLTGPTLRWRAGSIRTPGVVSHLELKLRALPRFPGAGDEALRGRVVLSGGVDDLERAFDAWKYGRISERPLVEATFPSLHDGGGGGHVMRAIVQWTPHGATGAADVERKMVNLVDELAPGFAASVESVTVTTPDDLEREYGPAGGHPLHAEPGLDSFFAWRPMLGSARYRIGIPGLYLCGSGAHPGGGVTGAPGANAAREVLADLKKRRRR